MSIFTSLAYPWLYSSSKNSKQGISSRGDLYSLKQKFATHFKSTDLSNHSQICDQLRNLPITYDEAKACLPAPLETQRYTKTVMLQLSNKAYVALLCWNEELGYSQIHDHSEASCYFTCLYKSVSEITYKANNQGILQRHHHSIITGKTVRYLPKGAIHQIKGYSNFCRFNLNPEYAMTAHLYTNSTEACNYYKEGQLISRLEPAYIS